MKRALYLLALGTILSGAAAVSVSGQPSGAIKLWRLDCGTIQVNDMDAFSDVKAYVGRKTRITDSCYLIKHGDSYLLWETGLPAALKGAAMNSKDTFSPTVTKTVVEQLNEIGVKPEQISLIGISHYHFDHLGQSDDFPKAKLMIGARDWEAMRANPVPFGINPALATAWTKNGGAVDPVTGDRDVFGDGTVTMLETPGHTPGHHSLLVKLVGMGPILLSGDVAHFRENYDSNGVPGFNTDRADSIASMERVKGLAKNLNATVVIQHDARDIAKLPAFPASAD
ncbi:N-acyl homoserine lactonase family protein [Sphingomonas sp. GlSt437]|uniref:N-acyl homoserine lactonase family protein n=1 Tax=Sphingomonas sp. GlSt437 TaxID=3389970 RepID=UPI003A84FAE4